MRTTTTTANTNTNKSNDKALFRELLSVTATSNKSSDSRVVPQAPPMPSRVLHKNDQGETNAAATVLRQLHRIVCNQAWSLRHVPEPIVKQRICVMNATNTAKTSATTNTQKKTKKTVQCASASRPFPFRHVEPVVKQVAVVGVREAWMRLSLRAIERSEFKLKSSKKTRVVSTPVVGVRDAWLKLALRAITRQEFTLKPSKTRETHLCVVVVDGKSKKNKSIVLPTVPMQLNHVNTRVRTTPVVGVRDGWMRLSLRAISRGEFELNHVPEPRVTRAVAVVVKGNDETSASKKKADEKKSNAAILRRNASLLTTIANSDTATATETFEAVRLFEALDAKARKLVIELLRL